jgi:hypothetical protein
MQNKIFIAEEGLAAMSFNISSLDCMVPLEVFSTAVFAKMPWRLYLSHVSLVELEPLAREGC